MNKMNKKRVLPVVLSLVVVSGIAVTGAAQSYSKTAAAKKLAPSSLTSINTSSYSDAAPSVASAISSAVTKSAESTAKSAAAASSDTSAVTASSKAAAVSTAPVSTAAAAKSKTANTGVKAYTINGVSCPNVDSATINKVLSAAKEAGNTASCKNGYEIVIGGNSGSIPNLESLLGASLNSAIQNGSLNCPSSGKTTTTTSSKPSSTTSTASKPAASSSTASTSSSQSTEAQQVLALVNQERAKNGLKALTLNTNVAKAAQLRATEIKTSFSHTRPNGQDPFTALNEFGVSYRTAGENIAYGQRSAQEVMTAWMNSSGHRANILNANFTQIGIGVYQSNGVYYWTQEFIG